MSEYVSSTVRSDISSRSSGNYVEVNRAALDALPAALKSQFKEIISKTVQDIHANALAIIREKNLIDTGNLLNSIFSYTDLDGLTGYVVVGAFYGIYLEYGTIRMAARPFIAPATEQALQPFVIAIGRAFEIAGAHA